MSFSSDVKNDLRSIKIKSKCCRAAYLTGLAAFSDARGETFAEATDGYTAKELAAAEEQLQRFVESGVFDFRCQNCAGCFARGVFISRGSVTSPESGYHLEFLFFDKSSRDRFTDFLTEHGLPPKKCTRRDTYCAYYKDSGSIEDILAFIGANKAAFDLMNEKIVREVRNAANRASNCDNANIMKSVSAGGRAADILRAFRDAGGFESLSPEVREAAELRVENESATLAELALMCETPVSKSGFNHRLAKALAAARAAAEDRQC